MKLLIYHGPGKKQFEETTQPGLHAPTDAIVRLAKTTICGTDLHILRDDLAAVAEGRVLGHERGVLLGSVQPGDTVAIVGAGPVGLAARRPTQFQAPARIIMLELDDNRREAAQKFGATDTVTSADGKAADKVRAITNGKGVAVAIAAVGMGATFGLCPDIVAAGGRLANIGVPGASVTRPMAKRWSRNLTLPTRPVDVLTTPRLPRTAA